MARNDVEFLGDDGRILGDDEELPIGARRRIPRWAVVVAIVGAAGTALGVAVASSGGSSTPATNHRAPQALNVVVSPSPANPAERSGAASRGVPLPSTAAVVDVAVDAGRLYVLQVDRFTVFDGKSLRVLATQPLDARVVAGIDRIVIDERLDHGWIVGMQDASGRVMTFDAHTLEIETTITMGDTIDHAAALDGDLFFSTQTALYRVVGYGIQPIRVLGMPASGSIVASDRTRHRLLVLTHEPHPTLAAVSPGGRVLASSPVSIRHADVAVTGATIWLTGDLPQGAIVRVLDPTMLRPGPDLDIETALGRSAEIVATGTGSLWLRDAYDGSNRLWCLNTQPGPDGPSWVTADHIASSTGVAYESDDATVRRLPLVANCVG